MTQCISYSSVQINYKLLTAWILIWWPFWALEFGILSLCFLNTALIFLPIFHIVCVLSRSPAIMPFRKNNVSSLIQSIPNYRSGTEVFFHLVNYGGSKMGKNFYALRCCFCFANRNLLNKIGCQQKWFALRVVIGYTAAKSIYIRKKDYTAAKSIHLKVV